MYSKTSKQWSGGLKYFADVTTHSLPSHECTKKFQTPVLYIPFSTLNNWSLCLCFTTCNEHFCGWRTGEELKISSPAHTLCVFSHTRGLQQARSPPGRTKHDGRDVSLMNPCHLYLMSVAQAVRLFYMCQGGRFESGGIFYTTALYQSSGRDSLTSFLSAFWQIYQQVFQSTFVDWKVVALSVRQFVCFVLLFSLH